MNLLESKSKVRGKRRVVKAIILAAFLLVIYALLTSDLTYAAEQAASTKLIETANLRLQAENAELKNEQAKLEAELNSLGSDRESIFAKLKVITGENTRLKDQITTLQQGLINADNLRKQPAEDKKEMSEKISGLEKELQPQSSPTAGYEKKISQLEKESQESLCIIEGMEKQSKGYLEEKAELKEKLKNAAAEFAEARRDVENLKKQTADMHYNLGVIFQGQNKYDDAIREYNMVLKIKPDDAEAHYNLGLIYDTVKSDRAQALYHYNKYLHINPDTDDALKVKEHIEALGAEQKIWGEPHAAGIGQKEKLGRW